MNGSRLLTGSQLFRLENIGRIAGEVGDDTMGIFQIEYLEYRVFRSLVIGLHDGILQCGCFDCRIVLKYGLAADTHPCKIGGGNADLNIGFSCMSL